MQQGEQIHRPVFVYPAEKRTHPPDSRAAGSLRRPAARPRRHRPPLGAALRCHRQRQDAGLSEAHRAVSGAGAARPRAGAGDQPDAPDDPPAEGPVRAACGCPALGAEPHRAAAAVADDTGRRRRHRGGDPQRHLRAAGKHRPHHHRRGAGAHLPLRVRAPVRRPGGGPAAGGGERLPAPSGQRYPQHRELLRGPAWPHPAGAADPALRRQPAAHGADRGYARRAGGRQPTGDQSVAGRCHPPQSGCRQADHFAAEPPGLPDHGPVRGLPRGAQVHKMQRADGVPQSGAQGIVPLLRQPDGTAHCVPRLRRQAAVPGLRHPESRGRAGKAVPGCAGAAHGSGFHCRKGCPRKAAGKVCKPRI